MADRLYTSIETDEILNALRFETKLEKAVLARIAFTVSLIESGKDVPKSTNYSGGEMKRPTFIGGDETFIRTIISYVHGDHALSEDEFFSNRSIIKNHIDNGSKYLQKMFVESGNDINVFLKRLINKIEFGGRKELRGHVLDIIIGKTLFQRNDYVIELNNTNKHANSNLAIMGKPGVGKTQFLLKILTDIRTQSNFQTNFIYFDYKGDVVDDERFLEVAKIESYRLLQDGINLPVNPFVLSAYDEQAINISAREKAESFASSNAMLGVVQKGALTEAIRSAYAKRSGSETPYPDFHDVLEIAVAMYEEQNKRDDSLIEMLRDLSNFDLFWKHGDSTPPIDKLTSHTMIIDVHAMPVLKELVAYLVIERLYKEMAILPDSPVNEGHRTIRTILVIDEAHNYLGQKNIFLQRIIREGRSKGIAVFFASQSPSDYQQKFFNFQELLEFAYIFQCEGVSASTIQDILGCSKRTANELQTEIARLDPFQLITRSDENTAEFIKLKAEAFYTNF